MNNFPVALHGTHNSPRIVAQRGVFTIFGQDTMTMDNIFRKYDFPTDCLIKFTFKKRLLQEIRNSLLAYGITESAVFPDLEGLAKELRRLYEFED